LDIYAYLKKKGVISCEKPQVEAVLL